MQNFIVITRPFPDAQETSDLFKDQGFDVFIQPLLAINPMESVLPEMTKYTGLVITSANALRALRGVQDSINFSQLDVYCVGSKTADMARSFGFRSVLDADGGGLELEALVAARADSDVARLLYVRGANVHYDLCAPLRDKGYTIDAHILYRSAAVEQLSDMFVSHLQNRNVQAITFFSKRTAENFCALVQKQQLGKALGGIKILCFSAGVLDCVRHLQSASTHVCEEPNMDSMVDLLGRVCLEKRGM